MPAIHGWVSGKVQGVYYRASTAKKANALGLKGWVRNLADGRVEFFAQGQEEALSVLEAWCKRGPVLAKVRSLDVVNEPENPVLTVFDVIK